MTAMMLSEYPDKDKEYQRVCQMLNVAIERHEHTSAKNQRLREEIIKLKRTIKYLQEG